MTNDSNIRRTVMRRVYVIRALRPFVSNAAGAIALMGFSLYLIGREVFVAQVFRNMPRDIDAVVSFFGSAFLHTSVIVQLLTLLAAFAGLWLARECVRLLSFDRQFA